MSYWRTKLSKGMVLLNGQEVKGDLVRQCMVVNAIALELDGVQEEKSYWGITEARAELNVLELPLTITVTNRLLDRLAALIDPNSEPAFKTTKEALG